MTGAPTVGPMADARGAGPGVGTFAEVFDAASTRRILAEVCRAQSLSSDGAQLLRLGENAIYQLRRDPVIVRIARYPDTCEKELAVSRWLEACDYPAARVIEDLPQMAVVGGRTITWWHLIESDPEPPQFEDLARVLRDLHSLSLDRHVPQLPQFDPMPRVARRLESAEESAGDVEYLRGRLKLLSAQYASLAFELPRGPIHGDAHVGNLMRDRSGSVRLIDFEAFASGPREWDISVVGAAFRGFGWMTSSEYSRCVAEYGWDVTEWPGFSTLRAIRELNMTSWLLQRKGESQEIDAEIQRRIDDLRDGESPRHWRRF